MFRVYFGHVAGAFRKLPGHVPGVFFNISNIFRTWLEYIAARVSRCVPDYFGRQISNKFDHVSDMFRISIAHISKTFQKRRGIATIAF